MINEDLIQRRTIAKKMLKEGFCTHYPGYICDKDWSGTSHTCIKCIATWCKKHPDIIEKYIHDNPELLEVGE